nr:hypothetical protein [Candidatus Sigynarchaeota archaeon]
MLAIRYFTGALVAMSHVSVTAPVLHDIVSWRRGAIVKGGIPWRSRFTIIDEWRLLA